MATRHPVDGSLPPWPAVAGACDWKALLLGNGLSMHVWGGFGYDSLFEQASVGSHHGGLAKPDKALFAALETQNFERILAGVSIAIKVAEALGQDAEPLYARYRSVQAALGAAIRGVHITRSEAPDHSLKAIKEVKDRSEELRDLRLDLLAQDLARFRLRWAP